MNAPYGPLIGWIQRKSRRTIIPLLLALTLCAGTMGAALQEVRFASGTCDNGRVWWSGTTYINGQACDIIGINCDGARYSRDQEISGSAGRVPMYHPSE